MKFGYVRVGLQGIHLLNGIPELNIDLGKQGARFLIERCAHLYCRIWQEPPWNEDFWEPEKVVNDILVQIDKDDSELLFACQLSIPHPEVVGFTWGYGVSAEEMREICACNELDSLFSNGRTVFYIDELGVSSSHRKHGLGERLSNFLLDSLASSGFHQVALRTDVAATAARSLYAKIGFRELPVRDANYVNRTYWVKELC